MCKNGVRFITCECGKHIRVAHDLKVMKGKIEAHAIEHSAQLSNLSAKIELRRISILLAKLAVLQIISPLSTL